MSRQTKTADARTARHPKTPIVGLSRLCRDAAEHVADARLALFAEGADTETALAHLDDAIGCLKSMVLESRELLGESKASRRTA